MLFKCRSPFRLYPPSLYIRYCFDWETPAAEWLNVFGGLSCCETPAPNGDRWTKTQIQYMFMKPCSHSIHMRGVAHVHDRTVMECITWVDCCRFLSGLFTWDTPLPKQEILYTSYSWGLKLWRSVTKSSCTKHWNCVFIDFSVSNSAWTVHILQVHNWHHEIIFVQS